MPSVPHKPTLRVVPLERIRPHEQVDPLRVDRLAGRIGQEGSQLNPVVCTKGSDGDFVLLDGATRTAALNSLGLQFVVAQVVEPDAVILETWHHVVREADPREVTESISSRNDLRMAGDEGAPRVWIPDGGRTSVYGKGISPNGALSSLVASYIGRWKVNRVAEAETEAVVWRFPDWAALIEFPSLTVEDVAKAALGDDLLPAGITRFIVPNRALRLSFDLSGLRAPGSADEKQAQLDLLMEERAGQGRIRRYEEPVVILDD